MRTNDSNPDGQDRMISAGGSLPFALVIGVAILSVTPHCLADDEALIMTPPGFARPGDAKMASGPDTARLRITVRDRTTGRPTPCRLNVVGPDGHFYQPAVNPLSPYSLTGQWPKTGKGNREGKAPLRYLGRFFYATGEIDVDVPAGNLRIEAWKGFEYRPEVKSIEAVAGRTIAVDILLERSLSMAPFGYHSGDPHLHFDRKTEADDRVILDLLEAEDIQFGSILAYNEPPGPVQGRDGDHGRAPAPRVGESLGPRRGETWIASGQEYRSSTYGHLNLYWRDDLVLSGQTVNANDWPLYGALGRETRQRGGFAIHAHGGYAPGDLCRLRPEERRRRRAAPVRRLSRDRAGRLVPDPQHRLSVPLRRGERLPRLPQAGRLPDLCSFAGEPRLRRLAQGRGRGTELRHQRADAPARSQRRASGRDHPQGRDGAAPRAGPRATACEVAPIQAVQIVVNGRVIHQQSVPAGQGRGTWIEIDRPLELSAFVVDRGAGVLEGAFRRPDAEAHTNPVYVYLGGKAPYDRDALDRLVARIDEQIAAHRERQFDEKARVLDDFQKSRDILLRIRREGGLPADGVPDAWLEDDAAAFDASRRTHPDDQLGRFLQPVPSPTPDEALKTFETVDGFRMELVAAEPLVQSPVAAAFDDDGNLYVAEMRDYPYKPRPGNTPLGTVRLLRDTDGDGRFDRSHVFADGLLWAAGHRAVEGRRVRHRAARHLVPEGYRRRWPGRRAQEGLHRVRHAEPAGDGQQPGLGPGPPDLRGGVGQRRDDPAGRRSPATGVSVEHGDFRFDPETGAFELVSGNDQFGNTFDDWGNRFICDESHPISQPVLPRRELARNPYLAVPTAVHDIAGGSVPIFRISPVEAWRQIRSSRRVAHSVRTPGSAGVSHHVVDAGAGVTVYRGGAYPAEFYGNIFVGDAQNNLIHRRILVPDGPTFTAVRGPREQATEFVRSSDNWFRPVNFVNAPDGTLYALDMSRAIIEAIHIPLDVVKHLDLKRGRDQGRIYRIAPPGFRHAPPPRLGHALDGRARRRAGPARRLVSRHGAPPDPRAAGPGRDRAAPQVAQPGGGPVPAGAGQCPLVPRGPRGAAG